MRTPLSIVMTVLFSCAVLTAQGTEPAPKPKEKPTAKQEAEAVAVLRNELGLRFSIKSSKLRRKIIRTSTPYGFSIRKVRKGSLAAKSGLTQGAIVMEVNGEPLHEVTELVAAWRAAKPGDTIRLDCTRRKKNAKLGDRHPWERFTVELVVPARKR